MGGIVVCAYSDVGYKCLKTLFDAGESVRLVYTHDDVPGEERWFDSVADLARAHGIVPRRVADLDDPLDEKSIRAVAPDFLFSFYFRKMIPGRILALARRGALNMHGSLLPAFRGRSPVNWAILKGATETGASLHYMTEKPDAGDLVDQERVPIGPEDDALVVSRRVADAAALVLARTLPRLKAGDAPRTPLDLSKGSYFGGRKPEDGLIDWTQYREGDPRPRPRRREALARRLHGRLRKEGHDLEDAPLAPRRARRVPRKGRADGALRDRLRGRRPHGRDPGGPARGRAGSRRRGIPLLAPEQRLTACES